MAELAEAFALVAATGIPPRQPYDLVDADYYELTQEEKDKLAGLEARQSELVGNEKTIRDTAESALTSLGSMVQMLFATCVGAIALGVFKSNSVPPLGIALVTSLSMVGFGGAIVAGICIAHSRLASLSWPVKLLRVRNAELQRDTTAFVTELTARRIYVSIFEYQKTHENPRHVQGTEFYLKEEPSTKVLSILSSSSHSQDLTRCYKITMWFYGVVGLVVLIAAIMGVLLAPKRGKSMV